MFGDFGCARVEGPLLGGEIEGPGMTLSSGGGVRVFDLATTAA